MVERIKHKERVRKARFPHSAALFLCALALTLPGSLFAQDAQDEAERAFPAGSYWSLDGGIGMGGLMEQGKSIEFIIDPKLWLSPALMVGAKAGINYAIEGDAKDPDPDATSDTLMVEGQAYIRWNFLRLGKNVNRKINIFAQLGVGVVAAYRGDDNPFDDRTETRGSAMGDAAIGVTIPLTDRWHIEPFFRAGYPHIMGVGITAGYKFPLPERTRVIQGATRVEYRNVIRALPPIEIAKLLSITSVEFIIFGPDIGSYQLGVDDDAQSLNDLVIARTADLLIEHPEYIVRLEGNANPVTTDPAEAEELMALSATRANTVAAELEKLGVPRDQMLVVAFGGTRTVTSNQERWQMNRRVELIIMHANAQEEE